MISAMVFVMVVSHVFKNIETIPFFLSEVVCVRQALYCYLLLLLHTVMDTTKK